MKYVKKLSFEEEPDYNYVESQLETIYEGLTEELNKRINVFLFDWQDNTNLEIMKKRSRKVKKTKIVKPFCEEFDKSILTINGIELEGDVDIEMKVAKFRSDKRVANFAQIEDEAGKGRSTSTNLVKMNSKNTLSSNTLSLKDFKSDLINEEKKLISSMFIPKIDASDFISKRLIIMQERYGEKARSLEKEASYFLTRSL